MRPARMIIVPIRPELNTSAGRPSTGEKIMNSCIRCGWPGGDDRPTIEDPYSPGDHIHLECDAPLTPADLDELARPEERLTEGR